MLRKGRLASKPSRQSAARSRQYAAGSTQEPLPSTCPSEDCSDEESAFGPNKKQIATLGMTGGRTIVPLGGPKAHGVSTFSVLSPAGNSIPTAWSGTLLRSRPGSRHDCRRLAHVGEGLPNHHRLMHFRVELRTLACRLQRRLRGGVNAPSLQQVRICVNLSY